MKKILIAIRDLNVGGAQKSLVNLLNQLEPEIESKKLSVDLLVLKPDGLLQKNISKNVNIIQANKSFLPFGVSDSEAKSLGKRFYIRRSIMALITKFFGNKWFLHRALKKQQTLGDYDLAISYSVSITDKLLYAGWTEIVLEKVNAKEKYVYILNDFVNSAINNKYVLGLLQKFDKIMFVSNSCKKGFELAYPQFNDKTDVLYTFVDSQEVLEKSKEDAKLNGDFEFNIITVARLSIEKAHVRTLNVLSKLKTEGFKFAWHVVGDGPYRKEIEAKIQELNLADNVFLYGNQVNPHKYTKNADLGLLTSTNESFGLVLIDAMLLGVPVLSTKTISAEEVVGEFGFVCENDQESLYNALKSILENKNLLQEKVHKLKDYSYNNEKIKTKFLQLVNLGDEQ